MRAVVALLAISAIAGLGAQGRVDPPRLEVDPAWPTLPETFFLGPVRGLWVDTRDHVWIVHDPAPITADIRGAAAVPPQAECCVPAPQVLEFDAGGKYLQGWNMSGTGYEPLDQVHGIFVDHTDHVWISSERQGDNHLLKFDRSGRFVLQIGRKGQSKGSNDTANVNRAADMFVSPKTWRIATITASRCSGPTERSCRRDTWRARRRRRTARSTRWRSRPMRSSGSCMSPTRGMAGSGFWTGGRVQKFVIRR